MKKYLCIYHSNCADGFGAALAMHTSKLGADTEFHPGVYQAPPPDVTDRDVFLLDFSYPRDVLVAIADKANTVTIIDHHKSAEADLSNTDDNPLPGNVTAIFDMEHSGAVLAWEYFHPDDEVPQLLLHIEDRDLWRFKLEGTREIQACLFSYPYDFAVWRELLHVNLDTMYADGAAIERKHHKDVAELIAVAADRANIAGYDVPILNAPYFYSSDAGMVMGKGEPFAICYWDTPKGRVFSLRSDAEGIDVSEVAAQYGGGGHKHAAGFTLPYKELHKLMQAA